jgi:glutaconyl-CoA/methylmalonyl-CoA decarboxylase subunit gamma
MDEIKVKIGGKEHKVKVEQTPDGKIRVHHEGEVFELEPGQSSIPESMLRKDGKGESMVVAPLPGIVYSVEVKKGDMVKKGQVLLTLVAMKMENDVIATRDGKIKSIEVKKNQTVNRGDVLVEIE